MATDKSYLPKIHKGDGGDSMTVESGGYIDFLAGAQIRVAGSDVTSSVSGEAVAGVAAGYKVARGVAAITAAGSGIATVVTGLTTVVAVVATMVDDPTTTCEMVTASIGDQSAAPVAGSVYLKGWKTLGGTPAAMTTTSVAVNWIAIGV
jgi:hypothetical protein